MPKSSEQRVEEILQRARANRRRREEEEGEAEQQRARAWELDKAFTAVRDFKPDLLCRNQERASPIEESAEAYAECIISLGRELAAKVDLLSTPPEKLADQGNEAKTVALAILGAGMQGDK